MKRPEINTTQRILIGSVCMSVLYIGSPSARAYQTTATPAQTVKQFYEMIGNGNIEDSQTLFLSPDGTEGRSKQLLDTSLTILAGALKRRRGIKSFTIRSQEAGVGYAVVRFEYTLADGTRVGDEHALVYDHDQWKIAKPIPLSSEAAAIISVKEISQAQVLYSVTKGRGKFTDLLTLGKEGLINSELMYGAMDGYFFASEPIVEENTPSMFDTTAKPQSVGAAGLGNRSYYSNESNVIYEAEGGEPPSATASDRVPRNGFPLSRDRSKTK